MSRSRTIAAVPAVALAVLLLAGCAPADVDPLPTGTAPTTSGAPTPEPTPDEVTDVTAEITANIIDAVSSGNTAALEPYLLGTVHVTYCASESEGDVDDPALVIDNITQLTPLTATWDFDLPAATLDTYANHPGHTPAYADDFPSGAIVGRSSVATVLSFVLNGDQISRVFLCTDEYALTFEE